MNNLELLEANLREQGILCARGEPLCNHTTFRIGGEAELFCAPKTVSQLRQVLELCRREQVKYYLLGKGSNTLFSDEGYHGAVISTLSLQDNIELDDNWIAAGAGVPLVTLCRMALGEGLSGLEFAYGIPGSLGGAVYMNAGAYGGEMKDVLESVTFLDEAGQLRTLPTEQLELGYRTSIFEKHPWCIVGATLRLHPGNKEEIQAKMEDYLSRRKEKQPLEYPSAGSTFKRPEGAFAGALIEQCGLRGYRVGGAAISQKHCGFVVNMGGATCADVVALCEEVKRQVQAKTGYLLEREIRIAE